MRDQGRRQPRANGSQIDATTLCRARRNNHLRRPHDAVVQLVTRLRHHHHGAGRHVGRRLLQNRLVKIRIERLAQRPRSARTDGWRASSCNCCCTSRKPASRFSASPAFSAASIARSMLSTHRQQIAQHRQRRVAPLVGNFARRAVAQVLHLGLQPQQPVVRRGEFVGRISRADVVDRVRAALCRSSALDGLVVRVSVLRCS